MTSQMNKINVLLEIYLRDAVDSVKNVYFHDCHIAFVFTDVSLT